MNITNAGCVLILLDGRYNRDKNKEFLKLCGSVENIIYQNEDNGFTALELNTGEELVTVVGEFLGVAEGEELDLLGEYVSHPKYGSQFKAAAYERVLPSNANAIYKYLASGVIKGLGPKTARNIVDAFGDQTLEIIENDPLSLSKIKGISQKKAMALAGEFRQIFGIRTVMMFLSKYGLPAFRSVLVWKKWGAAAVEMIKENPFQLCEDDIGLRFEDADAISEEFNISKEHPVRIKAGIVWVLKHNSNNGYTCLPENQLVALSESLLSLPTEKITKCLEDLIDGQDLFRVDRNKIYYYLPVFFNAEVYIAERVSCLLKSGDYIPEDIQKFIDDEEHENKISYGNLQKEAISKALEYNLFILTGGPGTGKTTTLNAIVSIFEKLDLKVAIAAPTGRAAKRISELTGREAKTIHRLLGVQSSVSVFGEFVYNENNPLKCDVVIIDEMSMVDTLLFSALLKAVKNSCKLILVGDSDQLPSVGAGNVLKDLIESGAVPVIALKEIFRQAALSLIVTNAHDIVNGKYPELDDKSNDFFFLDSLDAIRAKHTVADLCSTRLPKSYDFSPLEDIQVLSPSRKGELGTVELNKKLQDSLNPPSPEKTEIKFGAYTFRLGDKVMQIRNNYDAEWNRDGESGIGIFNGDIGVIRMVDRHSGVLAIDFDRRISYYNSDMLKELELAYAITIHKSQGNEFNAVILPLMGGYEKLYYRNLLYTAVTRAKKILIIVGKRDWVNYMVDNNRKTLRYTGLKSFINDAVIKI